jgi:hypothetical protein
MWQAAELAAATARLKQVQDERATIVAVQSTSAVCMEIGIPLDSK